jgi:hypothetical protein
MDITNKQGKTTAIDCPSIEIAAYIDGELTPDAELELESHLAHCRTCSDELNLQKQFVNALNGSLKRAPELPKDFAKRIVANAESGVSGLRRGKERVNAMFVCAALFFFVMFTLGASAPGAFSSFFGTLSGVYAVFSFVFHLIFDISEGIVILLRAFISQPSFDVPFVFGAVFIVAAIGYFIFQSRSSSRNDRLESGKIS